MVQLGLKLSWKKHIKRITHAEVRLSEIKIEQQETASKLWERLIGSFAELREELRIILAWTQQRF